MRRLGLDPGDELDEQFMSRPADRTDRELAAHKAAKRYAKEEEALGYDRRMSYRAARVVLAEWRPTTLPRTSEAGDRSRLGAGGSGHGWRDRGSGDSDPDWDAISSEIYGCLASRRTPFFVATPELADLDGKPTDFNDLRRSEDLDAVRRWLDPKMAGKAVTEAWEPLRRQAADDQRTHGGTLP